MQSTIVENRAQKDGRRAIRERHVDSVGVAHFIDYLADSDADVSEILAARVPLLETQLADAEIAANLSVIEGTGSGNLSVHYSTIPQNLRQIRQRFQTVTGLSACRLAKWLLTLTNSQLNALFGTNGVSVITLRTRLQSKANAGDNAVSQEGE